jgi:hypothetical protein
MMQARDAGRTANAVALANEPNGQESVVSDEAALGARFSLVRFGVTLSALVAAKALQSVAVFAKTLAIDTTTVAGHYGLELSSGRCHNGRGLRNPALDFGLRLLPLAGANCQREEFELEPARCRPRSVLALLQSYHSLHRYLKVVNQTWSSWNRSYESAFCQSAQCGVKHPEWILSQELNAHQSQLLANLRNGYSIISGAQKDSQAQHRQAFVQLSLVVGLNKRSQGLSGFFKFHNPLLCKLKFLPALDQFLLDRYQCLPVRVVVDVRHCGNIL